MSVSLYSCLSYAGRTLHPYSTMIRHLQPIWPYHIFFTLSHKCMILVKKN